MILTYNKVEKYARAIINFDILYVQHHVVGTELIPISVTKVGIRVAQYFPKVAQKEVKSEPKGCQIPGLQLKENSLPRPFKNSYISCHIASRSSDRL